MNKETLKLIEKFRERINITCNLHDIKGEECRVRLLQWLDALLGLTDLRI